MLHFSVRGLISKTQGTKENFTVDEAADFEDGDDLKLLKNIVFKVQFLKLPHEINVQIKNLTTAAECICSRCLKKISYDIEIPFAEREFIIDLPDRDLQEGEDSFYISRDKNEIDLTDMLREELLLHFPAIALCSESCKGLCDKCGANRNEEKCSCKPSIGAKNPFLSLTLK